MQEIEKKPHIKQHNNYFPPLTPLYPPSPPSHLPQGFVTIMFFIHPTIPPSRWRFSPFFTSGFQTTVSASGTNQFFSRFFRVFFFFSPPTMAAVGLGEITAPNCSEGGRGRN